MSSELWPGELNTRYDYDDVEAVHNPFADWYWSDAFYSVKADVAYPSEVIDIVTAAVPEAIGRSVVSVYRPSDTNFDLSVRL